MRHQSHPADRCSRRSDQPESFVATMKDKSNPHPSGIRTMHTIRGEFMQLRAQQTIRQPAETQGVGFLTGADVTLRFLPAPPNFGVQFQRLDLSGSDPVPATIDFAVPRARRTAISRDDVTIELIEHAMAALAGLQIDNCLVQLDAPEVPGFDGSCQPMVDALLQAGIERQAERRSVKRIEEPVTVQSPDGNCSVSARGFGITGLSISYHLDYGPDSPIPTQSHTFYVTPKAFVRDIAWSRTFILESEVDALKAQGYGKRTTAADLLVFGENGVIDNTLHAPDECVRHKILDCIGDFALLGCDLIGYFSASRSGHELNREICRELQSEQTEEILLPLRRAA